MNCNFGMKEGNTRGTPLYSSRGGQGVSSRHASPFKLDKVNASREVHSNHSVNCRQTGQDSMNGHKLGIDP